MNHRKAAQKLGRDVEVMRLIACLPDIYIKTRTKEQLCLIMSGIQPSCRKMSRDKVLETVLQYKREIIELHQTLKVADELERYRRQVNSLLKAIVNPSAIAGYHPELDRVTIINRLQSADFGDFNASEAHPEQSLGEMYEALYEGEDSDQDDTDYSRDQSENLGLTDRVDFSGWRETSQNTHQDVTEVD